MNESIPAAHEPVRTCLVCAGKRPKRELIRLGLDSEKECVIPDEKALMPGRGGYACRECLPKLRFNRRIQRAFRDKAKRIIINEYL